MFAACVMAPRETAINCNKLRDGGLLFRRSCLSAEVAHLIDIHFQPSVFKSVKSHIAASSAQRLTCGGMDGAGRGHVGSHSRTRVRAQHGEWPHSGVRRSVENLEITS